jgi:hypothetical protein
VDCSLFSAVGPLQKAGKRASDEGRDVSGSGYNCKWIYYAGCAARCGMVSFLIPLRVWYAATVLKPYSIGSQDQGRVILPLGDLDNGR